MTKGHVSRVWLVFAILLLAYLPPVSASGGGLLLTGDTFTVQGDQEVGAGDVNISVDVHAHGSDSENAVAQALDIVNQVPPFARAETARQRPKGAEAERKGFGQESEAARPYLIEMER